MRRLVIKVIIVMECHCIVRDPGIEVIMVVEYHCIVGEL